MYFTLAWRNIWRNKRRTIITMVSIAFAVVLSSIMRSMQLGSYDRMIDNSVRFFTGYIQIHDKGYWDDKTIDKSFKESPQLLEEIEAIPEVEAAVPRIESFALASYGLQSKGAMVLGIDPERENLLTEVDKKIVEGSNLTADDDGALVGSGLAEYLKMGIGDTLVLISQGYHGANAAGKYVIKGLVEFGSPVMNNQLVYLSLPAAQYFYAADGLLTTIAIVTDKPKYVNTIMASLNSMIDTEEMEIMDWQEMVPEMIQAIEIDNISGIIMLLLLYLVIGFGMFGTFLMMTKERLYEFGVTLSIGMKRWRIQLVVFLEILFLSFISVLLGFALSLPIISYFYHNPIRLPGDAAKAMESFDIEPIYVFSLEPIVFTSQAWVVFVMAVFLSSYPLWKISKIKPVEAMREG